MKGWNVTHRLDGQPNGDGNMTPITIADDTSQALTVGTRGDGNNRLTGGINELILIGSALSPSDVASMEGLLKTEYNLQPPISTNPTSVTFSLASNQLTLSWPVDHTGWQLQAQTNSLAVGISTNWVNVALRNNNKSGRRSDQLDQRQRVLPTDVSAVIAHAPENHVLYPQ